MKSLITLCLCLCTKSFLEGNYPIQGQHTSTVPILFGKGKQEDQEFRVTVASASYQPTWMTSDDVSKPPPQTRSCAGETVEWIKVLAGNPDNLNSVLGPTNR